MKTIQAVLVSIWGALIVVPSFAQEAHLRTLASTGSVQEVREALRYSSEVNKRDTSGVSTLMLAGSNHDASVIAVLISGGADINARSKSGETALFYAA